MTNQPVWEYLGNLGDASPVEHGGLFVFRDKTGVYTDEVSRWDADIHFLYRFPIDRLELWAGHLVPYGFTEKSHREGLPHPLNKYYEWFDGDLEAIGNFVGKTARELQAEFISPDPLVRARAYEDVGRYWGFDNFDSYPLHMSERSFEAWLKEHRI